MLVLLQNLLQVIALRKIYQNLNLDQNYIIKLMPKIRLNNFPMYLINQTMIFFADFKNYKG
jgi:hypothetical protein